MMPLRCCVQYTSKFGQLNSAHRTRKVQSSFQSLRRAVSKKVQTTTQLCSFHKLVKLCSKFFKLGFKKHEMRPSRCTSWVLTRKETRDQIANIYWIKEKAGNSGKISTSALLSTPKPLTVLIIMK